MRDTDCVTFLQWALPRLDLRWPGFRKVRGQVCKRIKRRMKDLRIATFDGYRRHIEADPEEWRVLDGFCAITISRFYRDRGVFGVLRTDILPAIAAQAKRQRRPARCWSAGCASGEEPYTLKMLWDLDVAPRFAGARLEIVATDIDETVLARAARGCYQPGSMRELPDAFAREVFEARDGEFCIRAPHREGIDFLRQDLRTQAPDGPFDLVLCRNTAFTYFAPELQKKVLRAIVDRLQCPGWLVVGTHEDLPLSLPGLAPLAQAHEIYAFHGSFA